MDTRKEDLDEDKAPRVRARRRPDDGGGGGEGCCGEGRVWIFLVLGVLALVFSAVLAGVYMNVRTLTTSMDSVEAMPSFVPAAAGGLTGLLTLLLFWKRFKLLVYSVLVLCAVTVVLCVIAAVLTGTHVLQPLLSVSGCVYSRRDRMCRCATPFRRDRLELEKLADGDQAYLVLQDVSSCGNLEDVLPGMLFAMVGIYGVVSLVCVAAGVISLLVYQTELRRRYLQDVEDDTCSPPPSPSSSGNYAEHHTMLPAHSASSATTLVNIYTNPNTATTEEDNINDDGNTTPSDVIYGPADVPMGYAEACSMRRCQSFSQPRSRALREGSPGSSSSSQTASLIGGDKAMSGVERGAGRLQEHRKKGRRAVTLHGLDREQLLLILSLQMRYLQESDQSTKREVATNNCNLANNKTACGPGGGLGGGLGSGPEVALGVGPGGGPGGGLSSGPGNGLSSGPGGGLSSGPGGGLSSGPGGGLSIGPGGGPGHYNAESSWMPSDQQRRAMTPTPRQERLSSSRTTDDDLDYRPAKLARSHTPQPYHFKNPGQYQYNQNLNSPPPLLYSPPPLLYSPPPLQNNPPPLLYNPPPLQYSPPPLQYSPPPLLPYQPHPYHQHKQPQQQQTQAAHHDDEEPPTLITYDLRNITKTGPIVYENVPSSASSLSHNPASNSTPLLQGSSSARVIPRLPQVSQLQPSPAHQPDPASQVLILGGNIHGSGKPRNQLSRQTSQASTSSQLSLESSPSDTRRLVPAKEKTPEPNQAKTKGKKKFNKKEKSLKKEEETSQAVSLNRTDSNASKGGVVADRWQTLMENGPKQTQTLWENVQRKIVSDPQTPDSRTPDSTLDLRHPQLSEHQPQGNTPAISSFMTPRHGSVQAVSAQKLRQQMSPSQAVPNGILKNSNTVANYPPGTSKTTHNTSQNVPPPLSPSQVMHYPNQFPTHKLNAHYPNAFVPVATSSVGNYEDIDEVFPPGQQPSFVPSSSQYSAELHAVPAPPKPPRIIGRQITKFGTVPSSAQPVSENPGQNLRPKSYMNAVDREVAGKNSFVSPGPGHGPQRAAAQGMDMEHHMMTHLLMEGPVMDSLCCHVTDRPTDGSGRFQTGSEYVYSQPRRKSNASSEVTALSPQHSPGHIYQPRRKSNASSEVTALSPQHSPGHIYQNACQHPDESGQFNNLQRHHLHADSVPHSQWSAFQSFNHNHQAVPPYPTDPHPAVPPFYEYSTDPHEICDTDLDDLPRPQHHRQPTRCQMYSPTANVAFPKGYLLEPGNRGMSTRSPSSSSCEPQNTSCTSSERSTTPSIDSQRGFPDHSGAPSQSQLRGLQPNHLTDHSGAPSQSQLRGLQPNHLTDHSGAPIRGLQPNHLTDHSGAPIRGLQPSHHLTDRRFCVTQHHQNQQLKPHQL